MGLTINITNPEKLTILKSNTHLIVSNHISYTDILILASLAPITFVTSVEMKHNSILGFITRLSGCLYTERRSTAGLHDEIESVSNYLKDEINVGIFPEGTSYDGKWLRPFHKSLFQSAVISETPVLPICIKYTHINSSMIDKEEREKLAWINHEPFNLHLKRILSYSSISVDVTILDELTDYSKGRKELAETAQSAISLVYSDKSQDC
jgi:1-acyl-sn-glycerol-3-phosphate acyltransferase